jgi:dihydrolipoamide dehydrogenase
MNSHDIAIIGAGPGGYVAAIKAAQLGKSVALIERDHVGGCCLNAGCIPTKTLLSNASVLQTVRHAKDFGISVGSVSFDYGQMKGQKDKIISKIRASLEGLLKTNKITIYRGMAQFQSPSELKILGQDSLSIAAGKIIIATGSAPLDIQAFPCDHQRILNSTSILEITALPQHLCIIGGGYIGCEFASLFNDLGVHITILEAAPMILAGLGVQISDCMTKAFRSRSIDIRTQTAVQKIENKKTHAAITMTNGQTLDADLVLIAVGRKIFTEGLALDRAGVAVNEKGAIETNSRMETAVKNIYAIGDVTGKWMLAHVALHQGIVAASNAAEHEMHIDYAAVPSVVFSRPEIGVVGRTLDQAIQDGFSATAGFFPFQALGKAQASMETEGFAQIVSDRKTGQILGAQIVGRDASNLIAQMALAIQNKLTLESIIHTIHAHPTMAESWWEAAGIANETPVHFPPRSKR